MAALDEKIVFQHDGATSGKANLPTIAKGLYPGVVIGTVPSNNTVEVKLDGHDAKVVCIWAAGFFSALLGFKTSYVPPMETKVMVFITGEALAYIVGAFPQDLADPGNQQRSITDPTGKTNYHNAQVFTGRNSGRAQVVAPHKPPVDLMEGEILIDNMMGVGIALLRGMAALSAGDLARVECHVIDDMVRIISDTFRHHTAFGDHEIFNDGGKLNMTWHGTHREHEALGLANAHDERAKYDPKDADKLDFSEINGFTDDGRWRFSQYVGWLGNFINLFVTDPVQAIGRIAADQVRSGKFRAHVNNDGSFLLQSVADIVLEKVVRIPVPVPLRRKDDPLGNRTDDTARGNEFLKTWKPSDNGNLFEMAFQLRDYARWLNNSYSLGRFRQQDRDYRIPTEHDTPAPELSAHEEDKETVNRGITNWRMAYSTIRIYRDGSIQTVDAYGNSFTSTAVGIQISSTSDILLQAAGSVNIVAGKNINLLARGSVDISAVKEFVRIKAQKGLMMLAAAGNIVLETIGKAVKIVGDLNANNTFSADAAGNVHAQQSIRTTQVFATLTMVLDEHTGHIFTGGPVIKSVSDEFKYGSDYNGADLYQTMSQQHMTKEGLGANWSFSENEVSGKGSPWPGAGATQKTNNKGESLQQPSSQTNFTNAPGPMASGPVTMKTK